MKTLLLKKSLKTILLSAVLSICSPNVWAQDEVKLGLTKFRYYHAYSSEHYLCEDNSSGIIFVSSELETNIFQVDTVSKGRYLISRDYEEKEGYSKGRYLFGNASMSLAYDPTPSEEAIDNSYFFDEPNSRLLNRFPLVDAIRIGNSLYVINNQQINDISKLDDLADAGDIKKIDLNNTNNFIFLFIDPRPDFEYPEKAKVIASEFAGEIAIRNNQEAHIMGLSVSPVSQSVFFIEPQEESNDDDGVGNVFLENTAKVSLSSKTLTINSPAKERIDVYSMSGALILSTQKPEGEVIYQINGLPADVIIVKGSSGWVEKIISTK